MTTRGAFHVKHQPSAGIVYVSDLRPDPAILQAALQTIRAAQLPIVGVTLGEAPWLPVDVVVPSEGPRGALTLFRQILAGLERLTTDVAFIAEHDVLYAPEHFRFRPPADQPDAYWYNTATYKLDVESGRCVTYVTKQVSGLCASRALLVEHYRTRVARVEQHGFTRRMGFEPGSHGRPERVDDVPSRTWHATVPNIDLRHRWNFTASRWSPEQFRNTPVGWAEVTAIPGWSMDQILRSVQRRVA